MRITVNLNDALVKKLDASAEAHHESRAVYAGMLIESQLSTHDAIYQQYVEELQHREDVIRRQTDEIQDLRRLLEEAREEGRKKSTIMEGEVGAILAQKNLRIEEMSATVARLESALALAPAAGDVEQLKKNVSDLRGEVHDRDIRIASLEARGEEVRGKCEMLEGVMCQHFREKEMMLALLPSAREEKRGFFARLFGKQD